MEVCILLNATPVTDAFIVAFQLFTRDAANYKLLVSLISYIISNLILSLYAL